MLIEVWIDGCCWPVNPGGTACTGYVIKKGGLTIAKGSKVIGEGKGMTSNVAEYHALIHVLEEIKKRQLYTEEILIRSDSNLLVNQMNGNWKVKAASIFALYREAKILAADLNLKIKWVPRELNEEADAMSRVAFKNWTAKNYDQIDSQSEKKLNSDLRTFPNFLTEGETKLESNRLEEMVKGFKKWNPKERIGETENFYIDLDKSEDLILLYGKEISDDCSFKLGIRKDEIDSIIELLSKGKKHLD